MTKITMDSQTMINLLEVKKIEQKLFENIEKCLLKQSGHNHRLVDYYQSIYSKYLVK